MHRLSHAVRSSSRRCTNERRALPRDTPAVTAGRRYQGSSLNVPLWGGARGRPTDLTTRASGRRGCVRATSTAATRIRPCGRSRRQIAELEGAEDALAFGSGMGAVASTVLALCSAGDHIVIQRQIYAGTIAFVQGPCARLGIEHTVVDGTRPGTFAEAVPPGRTMLVIAESPVHPRLDLIDLDELGAVSGPFTVPRLDVRHTDRPATAAPRHRPRPALGHQGDFRAQRRNTRRDRRSERPARRDLGGYSVLHGARGVAIRRPQRAAWDPHARRAPAPPGVGCAAPWRPRSAEHPGVAAVHYPGLPDHPQHVLAGRAGSSRACRRSSRTISLAASTPPARCSTPCASPARRRHSAGRRRSCVTRRWHPRQRAAGGAGGDGHHARVGAGVDRSGGRRRHHRRSRAGHPDLSLERGIAATARVDESLSGRRCALSPTELTSPAHESTSGFHRSALATGCFFGVAPPVGLQRTHHLSRKQLTTYIESETTVIGRSAPARLEHGGELHPLVRRVASPPAADGVPSGATAHAQPPGPDSPSTPHRCTRRVTGRWRR